MKIADMKHGEIEPAWERFEFNIIMLDPNALRVADAAPVQASQLYLEGLARVRAHLKGQIYGVLGNHDTIRMVPELEEMGIWMLLNECEVISRDNQHIYLPELMTHTIIASIILKRRPQKSLIAGFRSSCHTRRKFIARRHTPGSICSCPVTPMGARYICPAQFRSLWIPFYPGIWGPATGNIIICWATRLLASDPPLSRFA
jgi:hypothetical protein